MLTKTSTGRSETAPTEAIIAAICSFSCSPEHSMMYNGFAAIETSARPR
jgi:hypothetical protein